ncbi:DUF1877 family protein [Kitasatospora sp. NPDC048540]|uniref:DUF1877 family protein n=1 Tax=Kitasatospora sp. NPDC048540 TaxID=3155634 RepID=UPI0033E9B4F3
MRTTARPAPAALEEEWERDWLAQLDRAWDRLHRCLTDGSLTFGSGAHGSPHYPLSHAVLGGLPLYQGAGHLAALTEVQEVREVAAALEPLDAAWLRAVSSAWSRRPSPRGRSAGVRSVRRTSATCGRTSSTCARSTAAASRRSTSRSSRAPASRAARSAVSANSAPRPVMSSPLPRSRPRLPRAVRR